MPPDNRPDGGMPEPNRQVGFFGIRDRAFRTTLAVRIATG